MALMPHLKRATLALAAMIALAASTALAQCGGGGTGLAGVVINADGVLETKTYTDPGGKQARLRKQAAAAQQGDLLTAYSELRKISLPRLEQAVAALRAQGLPVDEAMRNLAGLTRIEYVFLYPASGDVVIAGPASGWYTDLSGRVLSTDTDRPVLNLDDLVVALRTYGPDAVYDKPLIGCSIDPTQEGLQSMQRYLASLGGRLSAPAATIQANLKKSLGPQKISVLGVPATTHFAQVMVEADYRMKLIGLELERPRVRITSFVSKVDPATANRNGLTRWYFVPDYKCLRVSDDEMAMQLVGDGVKLVGEDEMVTSGGERVVSGGASRASQVFTTSFTEKYAQLAAVSPVYAQLRNLIDMAVAAAFMRNHDYYAQAGWDMAFFGDEAKYAVETLNPPRYVDAVVTKLAKGSRTSFPIGGGVQIEADLAIARENLLADEGGALGSRRGELSLDHLAEGQWWWD